MKINRIFPPILLSIASISSFAECTNCDLPPPPLSAYMAYQNPKPPIQERAQNTLYFLTGWYVTGMLTYSFLNVNSIENATPLPVGEVGPTIATQDFSERKIAPGVAIGYQFRPSGFLSRAEIAYLPRPNLTYNVNPLFNPLVGVQSNINSNLSIHPVLLKFYSDFNFDAPIIPYIQAGVGASFNRTSGDADITLGIPPGPFVTEQRSGSSTLTQFAWDVGLGARWHVAPPIFLDLGYEFDSLGKARWELAGGGLTTLELESGNIYSNTILLGITWMPLAKAVEQDS